MSAEEREDIRQEYQDKTEELVDDWLEKYDEDSLSDEVPIDEIDRCMIGDKQLIRKCLRGETTAKAFLKDYPEVTNT